MCQQKCAVKGCRFLCAEKPCLIVAGMPPTHGCGVHRDMRIEAQAARLENAILDTRDREHLEADRFCNATSSGIDWTRTEGAALYAAVQAGQDAFRRGATSGEVVAAIHAAGAESSGPKFFGASIGRILWEGTATSLIAENEVVGNMIARFGTSEERATLAEISAEVSGLTRGERTWGRMARAVIS